MGSLHFEVRGTRGMTLEDLTDVGLAEFIEDSLDSLLDEIAGDEEFYDQIHRSYLASAMLRTRLTKGDKS